jgi:hypothetical protein
MKDSQAVKILRTFSKKEMKSFEKYLSSPYFNTSEATLKLFIVIKDFYPEFIGPHFTKEKLFARVYGKRKYSKDLMNKLASNLIKLSLGFIAINNNTLEQYNLLRGLRQKKLYNLFRSVFMKISKELERENVNEGDTIYQMLINMENSNFNLDIDNYSDLEISNMRFFELNTLHFIDRLAAYYIEKTNVAITSEEENKKIIHLLNDSINYENLFEKIAGSDLYHKKRLSHILSMILLRKTRNEMLYNELKASLFDTPLTDFSIINLGYIYLLDFITYKIKEGDESYFRERHQIYKKIEQDYFAPGQVKIIFTFFRNFILSGINCRDFEWARYVLEKYINDIEGKGNTGIKSYFEALISYHAGDFEGALTYINRFDLKKIVMDKFNVSFDIRFLRFKIYYEMDYIEEALSMIDSFEHFLKKDRRINKNVKPSYIGFTKYYKKLLQFKIKENYTSAGIIRDKIMKDKVHEMKWLMKKAEELSGIK